MWDVKEVTVRKLGAQTMGFTLTMWDVKYGNNKARPSVMVVLP